jgi:hypothetical protein
MSQILKKSIKSSGCKLSVACRFQKMLKNAYFLEKIGADTAENVRNFAKKNCQNPTQPSSRNKAQRIPPGAGGQRARGASARMFGRRSALLDGAALKCPLSDSVQFSWMYQRN